jgi:uncharacterized RDD family membrane protein YckC
MTTPTPSAAWEAPEPVAGPAPGVAFADHGERLIAYIIDVVIVFIATIALAIVGGILATIVPILAIVPFLGIFIISLVYFPYYWAKTGQTPGMKQQGIKVVRDRDGGPITMGTAILRLIGYWVSGLVFYIGYIWIFIDKRRRGWHDLIAGTVVVKA